MVEWEAFHRLEPWGCLAEDERIGTLAALVAEQYRDSQKWPDPFEAADFYPRLTPPLTPEEREKLRMEREAKEEEEKQLLFEAQLRTTQKQIALKPIPGDTRIDWSKFGG